MNSMMKIAAAGLIICLAANTASVQAKVRKGGTGFVINDQGYLVTNNHVVSYDIKTKDGKRYAGVCTQLDVKGGGYEGIADIVGRDRANDLAVLKIRNFAGGGGSSGGQSNANQGTAPKKDGKWRSLGSELAAGGSEGSSAREVFASRQSSDQTGTDGSFVILAAGELLSGERVVAVGYPLLFNLSSQPKVVTGVLASTAGLGHNVSRLQHTAPINQGNSGGPLFNASGQVMGVNVSMLDPGRTQNVNFSIKMGVTREFLDSLGVTYTSDRRGGELRTEQIMANAVRYTVRIHCHF